MTSGRPGLSVIRVLAAATCMLFAIRCSTLKVERDWNRTIDFSAYHTFSIKEGTKVRNLVLQQRIEAAATTVLEAKGLQTTIVSPQLLVYTHTRMTRERQIDYTTFGYGGWYGWAGWGPGRWSPGFATVREIPVGTLVIDLVDAGRRELVWRSMASRPITDAEGHSQEELTKVVAKMFADFPPRRAGEKG